jgi:hypothetical protein
VAVVDNINPRKVALKVARETLNKMPDEEMALLFTLCFKNVFTHGIETTREVFLLGVRAFIEVDTKIGLIEVFGSTKTANRAIYNELRFVLLQKALRGCVKIGLQKCKKMGRKLNLRGKRQDRRKGEK